jgi:photosystem II stability/assembly factor-like uncharacterized protein
MDLGMHFRLLALVSLLAFAGCHSQTDPPDTAPSGVAVTAGDGRVTVTWNPEPDLDYWIFFQPGSSVVAASPESLVVANAVSPQVVPSLANGTQYAFVMNATKHDSGAGPSSAVVTATPRPAGADWVSGGTLGAANLNGVAFGGGRFVTVGDSAAVFAGIYSYVSTNPPGVNAWLPPTPPFPAFSGDLRAVAYSGQFVALGADGSILTSGDGLTWLLAANPVPVAGMNGIAFGGGQYVAVGSGGSVFASTDLVTWTQATSNTVNDLYGVSYQNGGYIATGAGGTLLTSPDGSAWTVRNSNTANALRSVAFRLSTGIRYVAVGDAGTIVTSSDDGITWTPIAPVTPQNLRSVVYGSRFVAVGQGGAVVFSDDGTSWTTASAGSADLAQVVAAPAIYMAVGAAGANSISK